MLEIFVTIAGSLLLLLGLLGCVLPVLPGPPLSFAALLLLALVHHFSAPLTSTLIIVFAIATLIVTALDFVIPSLGAKKYGTSKWGVWGSVTGMVLGFVFFPPFGMLIGAFLGAVALELLISKRRGDALRAGWGVFVGALTAMVLKLTASGAMTYYFIRALL